MKLRIRNRSSKSTTTTNHNPNNDSNMSEQIKDCSVIVEDICKTNDGPSAAKKDLTSNQPKLLPCKVVLTDILKENPTPLMTSKDLGNGSNAKIFKCKMKKCGLKEFVPRDKAVSSCTKRIYDCVTPAGTVYLDCHSTNLVYSKCSLQYVGETVQQLNARFTAHRAGIKMPNKHGTCKILSSHFSKGLCKGSNYTVQILEKLEGTGRTDRKCIDVGATSVRRQR